MLRKTDLRIYSIEESSNDYLNSLLREVNSVKLKAYNTLTRLERKPFNYYYRLFNSEKLTHSFGARFNNLMIYNSMSFINYCTYKKITNPEEFLRNNNRQIDFSYRDCKVNDTTVTFPISHEKFGIWQIGYKSEGKMPAVNNIKRISLNESEGKIYLNLYHEGIILDSPVV